MDAYFRWKFGPDDLNASPSRPRGPLFLSLVSGQFTVFHVQTTGMMMRIHASQPSGRHEAQLPVANPPELSQSNLPL